LGPVAVYAGIAIANTLMIGLLQRRREFAALRLIGASQEQLRRMAALESLLVTAAALLLGGMVTGLVGGIVRHATLQVGEVPLSVPWWSLGAVLTACLGTALTATWVSARSITRSPA
ncbi:FtsX-like permease family protein, partial [Nocardioides sp.]|uniref:FtsX-like permease family protein n=1 Tax=Nocardioides sp. TaxID=35761 RepID=UPI00273539BE